MDRIPGVVIGIVRSVDDPEGQGRVQLRFPWLSETEPSAWAPVATYLAGNARGNFFLPEVEDEALVAFEHGDFDHPFVVGFLWNGSDLPPDDDQSPSVRRLRTVSGHEVVFDDRPGSEKVTIKSQGGHTVTLDDTGASVSVETTGGLNIKLEDGGQSITVQAGAKVMVKAPAIELGDGASQQAVLGNILESYLNTVVSIFNAHQHVGQLAAGVLPVTPAPPATPLTPPVGILSNVVKEV